MNERYICIHGHFYQPPRENPWLGTIERQESAAPYHDWNERINIECYAPNAQARILDEEGAVAKCLNNYRYISFNFGPTLLSWLERAAPATYRHILEADRQSQQRHSGHGNAIAQVYNHMIMPLANEHDQRTQVRWGIRDFEHRFGRRPEGMWLAETAVDTPTLEVLAAEGIRYTILAPGQATAVKAPGNNDWQPVDASSLDTRRAYICHLPSGKSIALFFYDGSISHDVAFNHLLHSGKAFAERLKTAFLPESHEPQLVHIATDGETYGHHHKFGEMALADCLDTLMSSGEVKLTNYGEFLMLHPPRWEVRIHERSSWSCAHGVERWRSDCGCHTGGEPGWHQRWRAPLRYALDWLRTRLDAVFVNHGSEFLHDPWAARDAYIDLLLDASDASMDAFFRTQAIPPDRASDRELILPLLEMQHQAMLMYTSCGWFFSEVSGIETLQILMYAQRGIDLAESSIFGGGLQQGFNSRLQLVPSNRFSNGFELLRDKVATAIGGPIWSLHDCLRENLQSTPPAAYQLRNIKTDLIKWGIGLQNPAEWEHMASACLLRSLHHFDSNPILPVIENFVEWLEQLPALGLHPDLTQARHIYTYLHDKMESGAWGHPRHGNWFSLFRKLGNLLGV